jgi:hypothetical protein
MSLRSEGHAEQAGGDIESRRDHVVQRQVGLDRGIVEIGAALAQLLGVVAPVPGGELEVAALLRDERLQGVAVRHGAGTGRFPDPLQKAAHGFRRLGHGILQPVGGKARIAEIFARSSRSLRTSRMMALLSLALPLSPRAMKAL